MKKNLKKNFFFGGHRKMQDTGNSLIRPTESSVRWLHNPQHKAHFQTEWIISGRFYSKSLESKQHFIRGFILLVVNQVF